MRMVYVIVGRRGEYSDREEWVAGVYDTKEGAVEAAETGKREAKEFKILLNKYFECANELGNIPYSIFYHNEALAKCGPIPNGIHADDYTVVEVTDMNTLGQYDTID